MCKDNEWDEQKKTKTKKTYNRSFYPSTSSTTSVRADSSILEEIPGRRYVVTIQQSRLGLHFCCVVLCDDRAGISAGRRSNMGYNPFRTAVPFRGQTGQILSHLYPKRDCCPKGVEICPLDVDGYYYIDTVCVESRKNSWDLGSISTRSVFQFFLVFFPKFR